PRTFPAPTTPSPRNGSRSSRATEMRSAPRLGLDILGDTLDWPFFEDRHRRFALELTTWADATLAGLPHADVDAACRARVAALCEGAGVRAAVPEPSAGRSPTPDVRSLCRAREILGSRDGLADFAFAMQRLGSGAISLAGSETLQARILPGVCE